MSSSDYVLPQSESTLSLSEAMHRALALFMFQNEAVRKLIKLGHINIIYANFEVEASQFYMLINNLVKTKTVPKQPYLLLYHCR